MEKQLIISVGREYGSGGHAIAEELAKRFDLPLFDNNLLEKIAQEKEVSHEDLLRYDEKPKSFIFSRTVRGFSNSMEELTAKMQFDYLKKKAEAGESFVIVGRCAETSLKDCPALVSIFVLGDWKAKLKRIQEKFGVTEAEAQRMMERNDWKRKSYHNNHCKGKWGDSRNYDLSVNSSRMGIDVTADFLELYVKLRLGQIQM